MVRFYRMKLWFDEDPRASLPATLGADLPRWSRPPGRTVGATFLLGEERWPLIPEIRAWGRSARALQLHEQGERAWSPEDARSASLVALVPRWLVPAEKFDVEEMVAVSPCPACTVPNLTLLGGPLRVEIPAHAPGAFAIKVGFRLFAAVSLELLDVLAGDGPPLETRRVTWPDGTEAPYQVVLGRADLGRAVATFGYDAGLVCELCARRTVEGMGGRRQLVSPRYSFYRVFRVSDPAVDVAWSSEDLDGPLLLSPAARDRVDRLARTLDGGDEHLGVDFLAAGVVGGADERLAFLPEEYHDVIDLSLIA